MKTRKAFTIIELLLAMSFIGTMLVGIASLMMRVTSIYQKGLSLRSVNAVGREIISDFTRIIGSSQVDVIINPTIPSDNSITKKQVNEARANYFVATYASEDRQAGGVFCTGDYSYIWNTAENLRLARKRFDGKSYTDAEIRKATAEDHVYVIAVKDGSNTRYIIPKLARFADHGREACASEAVTTGSGSSSVTKYYPTKNDGIKTNEYLFDFTKDGNTKVANDINELVERDESDLAIYNLTIFPATQHPKTKQIFYSGMFILATYRGGVNIKANGDFCEGSGNPETGERGTEFSLADFDYCAVNKFNFSARATGERGINQHGDNS